MGNQGHSSDGSRTGYEYIRGGAIGDVREVHVWTNRPLGFWPQGFRVRWLASMRVTNTIKGSGGTLTDPNAFLRRQYRPPWKLT